MASAGPFKIIANDGKSDRLIMANQLLNMRYNEIEQRRMQEGYEDPTPTLLDIERTHIIFVNAHFKPFVALGFEYVKVAGPNSIGFGGSAQYSIPQYGDFFADAVWNVQLEATSATVGTVPAFPAFIGANDQVAGATSSVSGTENVAGNTYTQYKHEYVSKNGTVLSVGAAATNYVKYCEFPGHRFFTHTKFDVNGNPLDSYYTDVYNFHYKFKVLPHQENGWKAMVGQEVAKQGVSDLLTISGTSSYDSVASNINDVNATAASGVPINASYSSRRESSILNGAQTPKATQPALEMWVPLLFWFNTDSRLAVPSVSIPYGQRFIAIDIAAQNKLLYVTPGDLCLKTTTSIFTTAGVGTGTAAGVGIAAVKKYVTYTPTLASGSTINSAQRILKLDLYINNIFLSPIVHDIYIHRIGFSLIRLHLRATKNLTAANENILLSALKFPIEYFYLGIRPSANVSDTNTNQPRDWHKFISLTDQVVDVNAKAESNVVTDATTVVSASGEMVSQSSVERVVYAEEIETIDDLKVEVHGIVLYRALKSSFYRDYIPYVYGGMHMNTPKDKGALMINFALHPGEYQPSGHINLSRAREFHIEYNSSYVSSSLTAELVVEATAINFLLISDGSAVLRYTT